MSQTAIETASVDALKSQLHALIRAATSVACGETPAPAEEPSADLPVAEELAALSGAIGLLAEAVADLRERAGLPRTVKASGARPGARFRGGPGGGAEVPQVALQRVREDLIQRVGLAPAAIILFGSSRRAQVPTAAIDHDGYLKLVESMVVDEKLREGIRRSRIPAPDVTETEAQLGEMLSMWRKYLQ